MRCIQSRCFVLRQAFFKDKGATVWLANTAEGLQLAAVQFLRSQTYGMPVMGPSPLCAHRMCSNWLATAALAVVGNLNTCPLLLLPVHST